MAGLVPERLEAKEMGLVLNVSELFQESPLFVMVILYVSVFVVLDLGLYPMVEFQLFPLFGWLFFV